MLSIQQQFFSFSFTHLETPFFCLFFVSLKHAVETLHFMRSQISHHPCAALGAKNETAPRARTSADHKKYKQSKIPTGRAGGDSCGVDSAYGRMVILREPWKERCTAFTLDKYLQKICKHAEKKDAK